MKKWLAIGGLMLVTVIWGGGFVASDMALGSMIPFMHTFFFKIINAMNGTITTFSAVRNAFLEGVVYCRPII